MKTEGSRKHKKAKRKVLLRDMTERGEGYRIAANPGTLYVFSCGRGGNKYIGIYGDPKGLRFLASLLNDVASVNQSKIPAENCPPSEGVHYHMNVRDGHLEPKSNNIIFGRLDAKGDGSYEWILPAETDNE